MSGNFIKLDRKILDWEWYSNPNVRMLFIHCLLCANWKDGVWNGHEYRRGQFITSLPNLATGTGLSIQQTRTALEHLELTGELTSYATNKFRIITVNNYDKYQGVNRPNNRQITDKQQTKQQANNRQINSSIRNNTTYYIKEEKEDKEGASANSLPSGVVETDPDDYMANYYKTRG